MRVRCARCPEPIRKGQPLVVTTFANYDGQVDGQTRISPWLSVIAHAKHEGPLTAEAILMAQSSGVVLADPKTTT